MTYGEKRRPIAVVAAALVVAVLSVAAAGNPQADRGIVTLPNGAIYAVEIPRTPEARQRGMMFRSKVPPRTGMLFVFETTGRYPFWMKNCLISLDLIWLDESKRIVAILPEAPPCKADPCPIYQFDVPSRYVLEIAGGAAKREGLAVGQVAKF